jgi:hypothetical protein
MATPTGPNSIGPDVKNLVNFFQGLEKNNSKPPQSSKSGQPASKLNRNHAADTTEMPHSLKQRNIIKSKQFAELTESISTIRKNKIGALNDASYFEKIPVNNVDADKKISALSTALANREIKDSTPKKKNRLS